LSRAVPKGLNRHAHAVQHRDVQIRNRSLVRIPHHTARFEFSIAAAGEDEQKQIETGYQMAFDRKPTQSESQAVVDFLRRHEPIIEERMAKNEKIALPEKMPAGMSKAHGAAVVDFCHMLINANEFVYTN